MVPWRCSTDGLVGADVVDWYGRLADGRPGVLVVEASGIRDVPSGPLMRVGHDRFVPGLAQLVTEVRRRSGGETLAFLQLIDFLAIKRRPSRGDFLQRFLAVTDRHREGLALDGSDEEVREVLLRLPHEELLALLSEREARDLEMGYRETVNDTHLDHIAELPRVLPGLFADAAERAREAGFDGVELHYAHAYTMASFLSPLNRRDDGYGTDPAGRQRLPLEVLAAVRERVGDELAVGCRLLGDEAIEGGGRIDEGRAAARALAAAGMDWISVSKGGKFEDARQPRVGEAAYPYTGPSGLECMPTVRMSGAAPFGRNLPLARAVRAALRADGLATPVVGAGGLNSFELCERALRQGDCDLVGAARQSLADPDWWLKMELGSGADIRRCEYTNYCEGLDQKHAQVTCRLWDRDFSAPDAGREGAARSPDGKRRLVPPPWERDD
ncbi:MAG: NADH oxidase [Planctomycetes bacterium]|jgi:2,4-dienoyl-CoA reductase-like NADH-dependent reductase (Old Yellow Enzyme family)|nr:NADH oxidase [Planctomycetota bacterium]